MISRVEEKYYNDIGKIARAMGRIAAVLEKSEDRKASQAERLEKDIFEELQETIRKADEAAMQTFEAPETADIDYIPPTNNSGTSAELELVAAGIGRRIKERLNELGMTKHELAIACGIDDKKIKLYTIGYTTPKAQTCEKIAEALECSVEWLLGTGGKENESVL